MTTLVFGFLLLLCSTVVSALTISIVTGDTASAAFIEFDVSRTVLQLKKKIEDDVFPNTQVKKMYFQGMLLDHELTLEAYGITEDSTVEVNSSTWGEDADLPAPGPDYIYDKEGRPIQENFRGSNKNKKNKKSSKGKGKGKGKKNGNKKDKKNKDKGKGKNKPNSKKTSGKKNKRKNKG